jgi:(p)ppGpp synthase/HD superfamily hydrolase
MSAFFHAPGAFIQLADGETLSHGRNFGHEQKLYHYITPGGVMMEPREVKAVRMAADIATKAHDGQYQDDGLAPYILHPARVAALVAMFGGRYQEVIASWLHDVLETNRQGEAKLAYGLSSLKLPGNDAIEIYRMIKALTRDPRVKKEDQVKESLERILDAPPGATLIKLCERLDNITNIESKKDREQYLEETMMVLAMLFGQSVESGYTRCHETLRRCMVDAGPEKQAPD